MDDVCCESGNSGGYGHARLIIVSQWALVLLWQACGYAMCSAPMLARPYRWVGCHKAMYADCVAARAFKPCFA